MSTPRPRPSTKPVTTKPGTTRPVTAKKAKAKPRTWPLYLSVAGFGLTFVLYMMAEFVAEHTWLTTLFAYAPPILLAIPTGLLLLITLAVKDRLAILVNLVAALFVLFVILGFNLPLGGTPPASALHFRLMSYNIEHGAAGIGKLVKEIRAENPDVFCMLEANGYNQYDDPLPLLQMSIPDYKFVRAGEALIASRLPIRKERTVRMVTVGGRIANEVEIDVQGTPVTIITAHLMTAAHPESLSKHEGEVSGYLHRTTSIRDEQIELLLEEARTRTTPVVLCGDFNTPPRGIYYRRLTDFFTDAFAAKGWGFGWTYPSDMPALRIDYIFTRQGVRPIKVYVPAVRASDHRPVVADIAVTKS